MPFEPILPKKSPFPDPARFGAVGNLLRDACATVVRGVQEGYRVPTSSSYVRTGKLGQRWTLDGPKLEGTDLVARAYTNLEYAKYVVGLKTKAPRQAARMARKGWPSVEDLAQQAWRNVRPQIERALKG